MKIEIDNSPLIQIEYFNRFIQKYPQNNAAKLMRYEIIENFIKDIIEKAKEQDENIFDIIPQINNNG